MFSKFKLYIITLLFLLFVQNSVFANGSANDAEGLPGRRVGGGTRLYEITNGELLFLLGVVL